MNPTGAEISELDTARFGIRVARAADFDAVDVAPLVAWCREGGVRLLIARCPSSRPGAAHAMESAGGRLMDTLVYWSRDLERRPFEAAAGKRPVRPATAGDRSRLSEVARASFNGYYGHYHADPRLDPAAATEGYADWALRLLAGSGPDSTVLLAEEEGRPMGFGVFVQREGQACDFLLAGVDPAAQGGGLYRAILSGGMEWATAAGCRRIYSSTPITNLGVQKVWARLGMELSDAVYTFHLWL